MQPACHAERRFLSISVFLCSSEKAQKEARIRRNLQIRASRQPLRAWAESETQKSQSSSSVASALPMT